VPLLRHTSETEIEESLYEVRTRTVNKYQYGLIFSPKKAYQSSIAAIFFTSTTAEYW